MDIDRERLDTADGGTTSTRRSATRRCDRLRRVPWRDGATIQRECRRATTCASAVSCLTRSCGIAIARSMCAGCTGSRKRSCLTRSGRNTFRKSFAGNAGLAHGTETEAVRSAIYTSTVLPLHVVERGANVFPLYLAPTDSNHYLMPRHERAEGECERRGPRLSGGDRSDRKRSVLSHARRAARTRISRRERRLIAAGLAARAAPREPGCAARLRRTRTPDCGAARYRDSRTRLDGGDVRADLRPIGPIPVSRRPSDRTGRTDCDRRLGARWQGRRDDAGPGQKTEREYTPLELAAFAEGATALAMTLDDALACLARRRAMCI